jgi:hypothetical protein
MNPQTKAVIKAATIGLAISLVVTAVGIVSEGRLKPIDPYLILNPGIIGHWVGRVGPIPAIFVIVAIGLRFREAGLWMSVLNFVGAVVGISLVISAGVVIAAAVYPVAEFPLAVPGPHRDDFVQKGLTSCFRSQRGRAENQGVPDGTISSFCKCYIDSLAETSTKEDIEYQVKHGTFSPHAVTKMTAAYNECNQNRKPTP